MSKENALSGYKYAAMSNLVLQADRRFVSRRTDENTGDPESLAGRINIRDMGNRIGGEVEKRSKLPSGLQRGSAREGEDVLEREQRKRKRDTQQNAQGFSLADIDVEDLRYKPRTAATRATYELIITLTARHLGDVSAQITVSAADAVLEVLKNTEMKDFDKKREIDDLLGSNMASKEFSELISLGKKITDYYDQDEDDARADGANGADDEELDERQGVAVVFDEDEDQDEDGIARTNEVRDEDESSDEEEDAFAARQGAEDATVSGGANPASGTDGEGEEMIIDDQSTAKKTQRKEEDSKLQAHDIDAFWLQRQLGQVFQDAHTQQEKTKEVLQLMSESGEDGAEKDLRDVENDLMELTDYEHAELVARLVVNRDLILWVTRWRQAAEDASERQTVERGMAEAGHRRILDQLLHRGGAEDDGPSKKRLKMDISNIPDPAKDVDMANGIDKGPLRPKQTINLENLVFTQGNHVMTNPNVKLPPGSVKKSYKGYEEISVPAPKRGPSDSKERLVSDMPQWTQAAFGSVKKLNRVQSQCYPAAFEDSGNMLVCSPTGSGKTIASFLAILRTIGQYRDSATGEINLDGFKIVCLAPLKALVAEQVGNLGQKLAPFGIKVAEMTGDRQLTKQQIAETNVIISTPEKLDVVMRKSDNASYLDLVRLVVIDEIHLLHDDRGPVLESIVARINRRSAQTGEAVRLVGLSATLPNYKDVSAFLRAEHTFFFGPEYRPCPLELQVAGTTAKRPITQLKTQNEICYSKTIQEAETSNQVLIFVHSRKETAKTAKYILDKALEQDEVGKIMRNDASTREILTAEAEATGNADLKALLPYGIGIHHAGMSRNDRTTVEDLFAEGYVKVLCSTATLAWGVNLPAHTVIIKGTKIYSPEYGDWRELSPQDVLQMLGRAGRPQYDTFGKGVLITTQTELQYWLSLLQSQLQIESQSIRNLPDMLNAEIVLGSVASLDQAVDWMGYTYYFIRSLRAPGLYGVSDAYDDDEALEQRRCDLVHSAAMILEKTGLIKYDRKDGKFQSTQFGRIASYYYITASSMEVYLRNLQPSISMIELFRVFALSQEFKYIPVRQDEKLELAKVLARCPVPIKESLDDPQAKINALLQTYISRLKLEGLALMTDMSYVTQSAGRLLRAIFEICVQKRYSATARLALSLCKTAEKRMWPVMTPLRQFPRTSDVGGVPTISNDIVQKAERVDVRWNSYFDLDPPRMGELLGLPRAGRQVCNAVAHFPRLQLDASISPLTPSVIRVELAIRPNFEWNDYLHGVSELFHVFCEDDDGETLLFIDQLVIRKQFAQSENNEHLVTFTVPITQPMPPNYFVSIVSDRWMGSESRIPLSLHNLILPARFPPHTPILDLQPLPISALKNDDYEVIYSGWKQFNKIQTQTFQALNSEENTFIGSATGTGKTACAEFAILRHWTKREASPAVYIAPNQDLIDAQLEDWKKRLSHVGGGKRLAKLSGDVADLRAFDAADLVLATPLQFETVSRNWQRRKIIQSLKLIIFDDLHHIAHDASYETVVARCRMIALQLENGLRLVGLSVPLADPRDLAETLGCSKHTSFNFSPQHRSIPLALSINTYDNAHYPSAMLALARQTYRTVVEQSPDKPAMIFVSSRKQCRQTAMDFLAQCIANEEVEDRFRHANMDELAPVLNKLDDKSLAESISHGIAQFHEALSSFDKSAVKYLFQRGAVQVLIASRDSRYELTGTNAHLVAIMGASVYSGTEHRYLDYNISEVLSMISRCGRPGVDSVCKTIVMAHSSKRDFYRKFLTEALPVESILPDALYDTFLAEISAKVIDSSQASIDYLTYTYYYRRLLANPSFYGLSDTSNDGISGHLSDLVETTLKELADAKMIEMDPEDDSITPENPAMIAAYYNISFITMQTFLLSLNKSTTMKALLEIVTSATEFENIAIRRREDRILRQIYERVPVKMSEPAYDTPHFKAFVLLQAHFSRMQLPIDLLKDQEVVLRKVLSLLSACVDILSSEGHLNAMLPMEMSQMVVQAVWDRDSPLKQIPHFEQETVAGANRFGVRDIYEFMEAMDPAENKDYKKLVAAMGLSQKQLAEAANFTNDKYPNVEMSFEVDGKDEVVAGEPARLSVTVQREVDEDGDGGDEDENGSGAAGLDLSVHAPFYPADKTESWWLVVGDEASRSLLGVKRVTVERKLAVRFEYVVPSAGSKELTLYLMSDSYVGVDQAPTFKVEVAEGEDDEDDEDEDGGGEGEDEEME